MSRPQKGRWEDLSKTEPDVLSTITLTQIDSGRVTFRSEGHMAIRKIDPNATVLHFSVPAGQPLEETEFDPRKTYSYGSDRKGWNHDSF